MRTDKYIYIILALLVCSSAQAQIPGFVGKRFTAHAGVLLSPAFHPTYGNRTERSLLDGSFSLYGVNMQQKLDINYAIKRTTTMGFEYQHSRTSNYITVYSEYYRRDVKYIRYVYANSFGLNWKFFNEKKGALAPLGNYQKLGINLIFSKSYDSLDNIDKVASSKTFFPSVTYGMGKTVILAKNLTFDWGLDISLMLDQNFVSVDESRFSYYSDAAYLRIRSLKFLNTHIGIGYVF